MKHHHNHEHRRCHRGRRRPPHHHDEHHARARKHSATRNPPAGNNPTRLLSRIAKAVQHGEPISAELFQRLHEHQRDLEQRLADMADLIESVEHLQLDEEE